MALRISWNTSCGTGLVKSTPDTSAANRGCERRDFDVLIAGLSRVRHVIDGFSVFSMAATACCVVVDAKG